MIILGHESYADYFFINQHSTLWFFRHATFGGGGEIESVGINDRLAITYALSQRIFKD